MTTTTAPPSDRPASSTAVSPTSTTHSTDATASTEPPAATTRSPDGSSGPGEHTPVTCPAATITVRSAGELQAALAAAAPGAVIHLDDGVYGGGFVAAASGTASQPIFLCGGPGAVLDGGGTTKGYVLHLQKVQYWRVVGFTVRNGQKGVVADSSANCVLQDLTVEDIGDEGIHLRSASTDNAVIGNRVQRTGLRRDKFGEGIYIGSAMSNWPQYSGGEPDRSDRNVVQHNTISATSSESIDIKEGTTGGLVIGNVMDGSGMTGADSLVDVKGNDWVIQGNDGRHGPKDAMQTHRILTGWGTGNTFSQNVVDVDGDGDHFYIHDPQETDNRVACDNSTASGKPLKSNVDCV